MMEDKFSQVAHIGLLIAFVAIVLTACFTPVKAAEVYDFGARLTAEIETALNKGDLVKAEQLSRIAAQVEAAKMSREATAAIWLQTQQLKRLDNLFRSAPAFLAGVEKLAVKSDALKEGSDDWLALQFVKLGLRAADRPLTEDEVLNGLRLRK